MSGPAGRNLMLDLAAAVCDGTATEDERRRLEQILTEDRGLWPDYLGYMHLHAALGDRFRRPGPPTRPSDPVAARRRGLTRRDAIGFGTGLAAGVGLGAAFLSREWAREQIFTSGPIRLAVLQAVGRVWVGPTLVENSIAIQPGDTVTVEGQNSSAVIGYSDGTSVTLTNDTIVAVGANGRHLKLRQGAATAGVPAQASGGQPLILETTEVTLSRLSSVVTTVGRVLSTGTTEVGVHKGQVSVASATGAALGNVKHGEVMTVRADGKPTTRTVPPTPAAFAWDLSRPLPSGWHVGIREVTKDGPVVRPEEWFDPFHQARMFQIRSDHKWAWGFFRLMPDSVFRVRYWVEQPGPSQLCICARQDRLPDSDTAMLECNTAFTAARPREWQWLEVKAGDMINPKDAERFPAPWVGFLVIFNTYKVDLGLKIAEFQVVPSGGVAGRG